MVLYGLKTEGETTEPRGVVSSIRESFIDIPDDISDPSKGPLAEGNITFRNWRLDRRYQRFIKKHRKNTNNVNVIEEDMKKIRKILETPESKKIKKHIKKEKKMFSVVQEGKQITVSLASSFLYKKDEFRLSRKQMVSLSPLAKFLSTLDRDIIVEAYAQDSEMMKGLELASLRATFMVKYLNKEFNVPIDKILPYGYELTGDVQNKSKNLGRRVDLKIVYE